MPTIAPGAYITDLTFRPGSNPHPLGDPGSVWSNYTFLIKLWIIRVHISETLAVHQMLCQMDHTENLIGLRKKLKFRKKKLSENGNTSMFIFTYLLNFLFYIGVQPFNNVVIVSGEQQRNSVIHIHVSNLPRTPPHPGCQITLSKTPCAIQQVLVSYPL